MMEKSNLTEGPWDKAFLNVIEHACLRAIERSFSGILDEAIKQALALSATMTGHLVRHITRSGFVPFTRPSRRPNALSARE
jgi:hypothetical protein